MPCASAGVVAKAKRHQRRRRAEGGAFDLLRAIRWMGVHDWQPLGADDASSLARAVAAAILPRR